MAELLGGSSSGGGIPGVIYETLEEYKVPEGMVRSREIFSKAEAPTLYKLFGNSESSDFVFGFQREALNKSECTAWDTNQGETLALILESPGVHKIQKDGRETLLHDFIAASGISGSVRGMARKNASNSNTLVILWSNSINSSLSVVVSKSNDLGYTWTHKVLTSGSGPGFQNLSMNASNGEILWAGDRWIMHLGGSYFYSFDAVNWTFCGETLNYLNNYGVSLAYHQSSNTLWAMSASQDNGSQSFYFGKTVVSNAMTDLSIIGGHNGNTGGRLIIADGDGNNSDNIRVTDAHFEFAGDNMVIRVRQGNTYHTVAWFNKSKVGSFQTSDTYDYETHPDLDGKLTLYLPNNIRFNSFDNTVCVAHDRASLGQFTMIAEKLNGSVEAHYAHAVKNGGGPILLATKNSVRLGGVTVSKKSSSTHAVFPGFSESAATVKG